MSAPAASTGDLNVCVCSIPLWSGPPNNTTLITKLTHRCHVDKNKLSAVHKRHTHRDCIFHSLVTKKTGCMGSLCHGKAFLYSTFGGFRWWLFPRMQGFWENVWKSIPQLHFFFFGFKWRLAYANRFHSLGQDQSTVAQWPETTVTECFLTFRSTFAHGIKCTHTKKVE